MNQRGGPAWTGRLQGVRAELGTRGLDALVVSTPLNIAYLIGFSASAGLLVVTGVDAVLIVDGRYDLAVRKAVADSEIAPVVAERVEKRYDLTLGQVLVQRRFGRVGFEAGHVTVANLDGWKRAASGIEWVSTERLVEVRRAIKDSGEVATFRRAGRLIAEVAGRFREWVVPGRSEREIASAIEGALKSAGFERLSFPTIVASGPNSARPHAHPGERRLTAGDLVVLDFGGVLDGYCVDLTRMAAIAPVAPAASELVGSVREAQSAAVASVRPGVTSSEIDAAARRVLEARGLGPAFVHAVGHGLGLEVHEWPRLARADLDVPVTLEAGMVVAVEPGAYVEGVGGVRLEDDLLVTADGHEVLTEAPRELVVV